MEDPSVSTEIGMSVIRGCLVVPIQVELYDGAVLRIQKDILESVQATAVRGVIMDVSAVCVMDTFAFNTLANTARMASLLGARVVLAGLQPGVVSALVDLDVEFGDIRTALTLEDGLEQLQPRGSALGQPEEAEDGDAEVEAHDGLECDDEEEHRGT